jgi:hypothetical protein
VEGSELDRYREEWSDWLRSATPGSEGS